MAQKLSDAFNSVFLIVLIQFTKLNYDNIKILF